MAFSIFNVSCCYAANPLGSDQALLTPPVWTEKFASTGVTQAALSNGRPVFHIRATVDCYVTIGANPVAATGPQFPIAANTDYDIVGQPGDKVAWLPV